jgi:hypothetical protein
VTPQEGRNFLDLSNKKHCFALGAQLNTTLHTKRSPGHVQRVQPQDCCFIIVGNALLKHTFNKCVFSVVAQSPLYILSAPLYFHISWQQLMEIISEWSWIPWQLMYCRFMFISPEW